jgi:hypothetical protein
LGDTPTRTTTALSGSALTSGRYELDASVVSLRVGLLFETPFADWLDLQFGGGGIGAVVQGTFKVQEITTVAALRTTSISLESDESDFIGGAYGEVNLSIRAARSLHALLGLQYMYLSDYSQEAGQKVVELDMKSMLSATVGVVFSF